MDKFTKLIAIIFLSYISLFTLVFLTQGNKEFIFYIFIILIFTTLFLISTNKGIKYSKTTMVGFVIWGFLHMLGGTEMSNGDIFYTLILIDLIGEPYSILKYDQITHLFGFGITTFAVFDILKHQLPAAPSTKITLFVVVFAAMGLGALNEIIEFCATLLIANVNVGGYVNTSIDLISNATGALIAGAIIYYQNFSKKAKSLKTPN